ncbi:MAG: biliverdin-producing heme oxygenase [Gemmataceae bacterium]
MLATLSTEDYVMELSKLIRKKIQSVHHAIETLPVSKAMIEGTIQREKYVSLLQQLGPVHQTIEEGTFQNEGIFPPCEFGRARSQCIEADLEYFGIIGRDPLLPESQDFVDQVQRWSEERPWALFGALYIVEGSRMGSMILVRHLSRSFAVTASPGHGLDYHLDGIDTLHHRWGQFKATLDSWELTEDQRVDVIEGAAQTMQGLFAIYQSVGESREAQVTSRERIMQPSVS